MSFIILGCLLAPQVVPARSVHLSKTGDDENSGTDAGVHLEHVNPARDAMLSAVVVGARACIKQCNVKCEE